MNDSNFSDYQVENSICKKPVIDKDSIAAFRTVHPNIAPVGNLTKWQVYTNVNSPNKHPQTR